VQEPALFCRNVTAGTFPLPSEPGFEIFIIFEIWFWWWHRNSTVNCVFHCPISLLFSFPTFPLSVHSFAIQTFSDLLTPDGSDLSRGRVDGLAIITEGWQLCLISTDILYGVSLEVLAKP